MRAQKTLVPPIPGLKLRYLHRAGAAVIGVYAAFHIANHLAGLNGAAAHIATMDLLRHVYRHPVVETLLLAAFGMQIATGLYFVVSGWNRRRGAIAWLQAVSGAYLAFFVSVHVAAVLMGRTLFDLDTNFYFAAAGLHVSPFNWFFVPYYFLSIAALFTHLGCAAWRRWAHTAPRRAAMVLGTMVSAGIACSAAVTAVLLGWVHAFDIPPEYLATYGVAR